MQPNEVKSCLFIHRRSPHGSANPVESLDMAYTFAAFEHHVSLFFMGEGVFQILDGQATAGLGFKHFAPIFKAWEDYELDALYVEAAALTLYNLTPEDFLVPVTVLDDEAIRSLFQAQDCVLSD